MLSSNRISAVLVSTDLEDSQRFYDDKVGMPLSPETIPNHLLFEAGHGAAFLIHGRPRGHIADHTQAGLWSTDNV